MMLRNWINQTNSQCAQISPDSASGRSNVVPERSMMIAAGVE
jgi:hypothetical protein